MNLDHPENSGDGPGRVGWVLLFAIGLTLAACRAGDERRPLRIATTTSLEASGLLPVLLPAFERSSGIPVHAVAVGTGHALRLAESGDCDVVLVHDREGEERLIASGALVARRVFARNDFVIVGPPADPAEIRGAASAAEALRRIRERGAVFVSRGDDSGTHRAERRLWLAAGGEPGAPGYLSAGQGMMETLVMADEKRAYTLSDRATFLRAKARLELAIMVRQDAALANEYAVLRVNPDRHPGLRHREAARLTEFLLSPEGQRLIVSLSVDGQRLFDPAGEAVP